jgi:copper chaperone CopZ
MPRVRLLINGMHCGGCVNRVSIALKSMPGVVVEQVEVGAARVAFDDAQSSTAALTEKISGLGFKVTKTEPLAAG